MAYESGVPQTVDPLAGFYSIETLTNEIRSAHRSMDLIEALGGMLKAIERGYVQQEIRNAAYEYQQQVVGRRSRCGGSKPLYGRRRKTHPDAAH